MSVDAATNLLNATSAAPRREASRGSPAARRLFTAFFACTLAIPAAPVNKGLFALLVIWMLWDEYRHRAPQRFPSMAPLVIIGIFVYGFALALVNQVNLPVAVQFLFATFVLSLVYFVAAHDIDMDKLAISGSYLLLVCTAVFWITLLLPGQPLAEAIHQFLADYNLSANSEREFFDGDLTFTLQLGTAPFLFIGFCVIGMRLITPARRATDWLALPLLFAGIVVSGQRALIGITLLYAAYLWMTFTRRSRRWMVIVALMLLAVAVWVAVLADSNVFSSNEESNSVKIGHFLSYLDDMTPGSALFGRGLASYYYSSGSHSMKSDTELTPIDLCRYFGIPLTLVVYAVLFLPLRGLWRLARRRWGYTVAMLLFTLLSMSNPVMLNSFGLLVVIWYWCSLVPRDAAPERGIAEVAP